jgi:hypothetical protein
MTFKQKDGLGKKNYYRCLLNINKTLKFNCKSISKKNIKLH